jgi:polyferredoxin
MAKENSDVNKEAEQVDLSTEADASCAPLPQKELWHPEKERMKLAYWVLAAIFFIFVLSLLANYLAHQNYIDVMLSNSLFEFCKTSLLPVVTLILGFYFSKEH